jgi:hypothetical protein
MERPALDRIRDLSVCVIVSLFHPLYALSWALARPTADRPFTVLPNRHHTKLALTDRAAELLR